MRATIYYVVFAVVAVGVLWWVVSYYMQSGNSQEMVAQKAAENAAKAENPFSTENPLSNIEADPLEKTKKVLNPFE